MTTANPTGTAAGFMSAAPTKDVMGNTPWAHRYAAELRRVVVEHATNSPRSMQTFLGPSELGVGCDRQVAGKMAGIRPTNHVVDPWAAVVGTAVHAWLAEAFMADNERHGLLRWVAEQRVTAIVGHSGSADLYDAVEQAVVDHKILGQTTMAKVRAESGPPMHYQIQLLLYGAGFRALGMPVKRIALAAYPRTSHRLDGLYVWERAVTDLELVELVKEVIRLTQVRKQWAADIQSGRATLHDVPASPEDDRCYFPLAAETEVVTDTGIRSIAELAGSAHRLLVPSKGAASSIGSFTEVPVRTNGKQRLHRIELRRGRATKIVHATAEHRWILTDGTVATTSTEGGPILGPGVKLASVCAPRTRAERMDVAVAQGFTFGDGAHGQGRRPGTLAIYGRSHKAVMLKFFPNTPRRYETPQDDVQHIYGLPRYWKDLPPIEESQAFLLSWLAGYFAADGSVTDAGQATISSASEDALRFVRDVAAICGVRHGLLRSRERLGYGSAPTLLHTLDLSARDLPEWFWLLPHHAERIQRRIRTTERSTHWSVVSVTPTDRIETVYCATVPEVEAFGLADGLTTGNCPFYRPQAAHDGGPGCPGNRLH